MHRSEWKTITFQNNKKYLITCFPTRYRDFSCKPRHILLGKIISKSRSSLSLLRLKIRCYTRSITVAFYYNFFSTIVCNVAIRRKETKMELVIKFNNFVNITNCFFINQLAIFLPPGARLTKKNWKKMQICV